MTLKERIEEKIYSSIRRATRHCPNCNQEFLYEQSIDVPQATTDILKAVEEDKDSLNIVSTEWIDGKLFIFTTNTIFIRLENGKLEKQTIEIIDDMKERIG